MTELYDKIYITRRTPERPLTQKYYVQDGDNIYFIAHKYLGDAMKWRELCLLNRISNPLLLPRIIEVPINV